MTLIMRAGHTTTGFPAGVKVICMDLNSYGELGEVVGKCDCFVHLAWSGTRGKARMDAALQERNYKNSVAAVKSMLDAGCRRVITAGSQAEYGRHSGMISEHSECYPDTEYGKAKLRFYHKTKELCEGVGAEYREPRFFSLFGPDDYSETMIISTLRKMLLDMPCEMTQCVQKWDFLYIDDAIDALYRLCVGDCPSGIYNLANGNCRMLREYVMDMARLTETKSLLGFGMIPYSEEGMVSLWPDVSKIRTVLGWEPKVSFIEGIERTIYKLKQADTKKELDVW